MKKAVFDVTYKIDECVKTLEVFKILWIWLNKHKLYFSDKFMVMKANISSC